MRCRKSDSLPASSSSSPASSQVPLQWKHLSTARPLNLMVVSSKPHLGQCMKCSAFKRSSSSSFILRARSIVRLCRRVASSFAKNSSSSWDGFLVPLMTLSLGRGLVARRRTRQLHRLVVVRFLRLVGLLVVVALRFWFRLGLRRFVGLLVVARRLRRIVGCRRGALGLEV